MSKKPSVTDLLDLLAKPALIAWANKQGLSGIDIQEQRKVAKANGTSIHSQIESGAFEREIDAQSFAYFAGQVEIIDSEQKIETEWFVGRYDIRLTYGGREFIADYKSGFRGKVYLEHKLQLVAYTMAKPALMALVPVPQFHLIPIEIHDRKPYEDMLIQLSRLYQLKKEIDRV